MNKMENKLVMKRKFNANVFLENFNAIKSSNLVSINNSCILMIIAFTGWSHYLLRPPIHNKVKFEEYKEMSNEQLDQEKS